MASLTMIDPAATLPVSPTSAPALLKTDARGRVRATPERRAAILAEFDRSGWANNSDVRAKNFKGNESGFDQGR